MEGGFCFESTGYMAVQLPPCTLAFDAVDPNSRFAPKLKLKVGNSELIAWLRAMDDKAKDALADNWAEQLVEPRQVVRGNVGRREVMVAAVAPLDAWHGRQDAFAECVRKDVRHNADELVQLRAKLLPH